MRDRKGLEVDLIADLGRTVLALECKSGRTVHDEFFESLVRLASALESRRDEIGRLQGYLAYGGEEAFVHRGVAVTPWRRLDDIDWTGGP